MSGNKAIKLSFCLLLISLILSSCAGKDQRVNESKALETTGSHQSESEETREDKPVITTETEHSQDSSVSESESAEESKSPESEESKSPESKKNNEKAEAPIFRKYHQLLDEHEEISIKDAMDMAENDETFLLYLGLRDCPNCARVFPLLDKYSSQYEIPLYYVDAENYKEKYFQEFMRKYEFKTVPMLFKAEDQTFTKVKLEKPYSLENLEKYLN